MVPSPLDTAGATLEVLAGDRLADLRPEWQALWGLCPEATPFEAPAWLLPWARHYAPERCRAVTARREGRLVAVLPVFEWECALLLAGTGPSDYGGALFLPGSEQLAGELLSAAVTDWARAVHRVDLQQLPRRSPLVSAAAVAGWADSLEQGVVCPVLPVRGENGMAAASPRWRKNWSYAIRRIEREGGILDMAPASELAETVAALERLHALRWSERGEPGVLADDLLCRFLRDAVPDLWASKLLRLHRLRFGSGIAAVLLALHGHGQTHYYLSGFDPALSHLSPGTALVGRAIAYAAAENAAEFHFLRGREAYKYRWGADDRPTVRRVLTRGEAGMA